MNRELEMAKLACRALDEKKGKDIKVIDIHEVSVIADYFVIASASNERLLLALKDHIEDACNKERYYVKNIEGRKNCKWILMDYGDIIIHIFSKEDRLFYDLERTWRDGKVVDVSDL